MDIRRTIPEFIKRALRPAYRLLRAEAACRLGWFSSDFDLVGYETLTEAMRKAGCDRLPGDFVEIGAFLGGGTRKLGDFARSCGKKVWVVDIFDPSFDVTANADGTRMADLYLSSLKHRSQEKVFRAVTRPVADVLEVVQQDSRTVRFPEGLRFAFGFIDGNHDPEFVKSDFRLVWSRLTPGGLLGFHDYGGDLPGVTQAIDQLVDEFRAEIESTTQVPEKWLMFLRRKAEPVGTSTHSSR
jgi:hypothetical protein